MPKKLNRDELIKLLQIVDEKLDENAELIAIGGTALNLLGLKKVTFDADFILENPDPLLKVDIILHITTAGVDTQIQDPGTIVMFELPHDYKRTVLEDKELNRLFTKIQIKILPPLDVLITKLSRFDPKDIKDITASRSILFQQ